MASSPSHLYTAQFVVWSATADRVEADILTKHIEAAGWADARRKVQWTATAFNRRNQHHHIQPISIARSGRHEVA
ncbi:MAG TPA: hypothetical protein VKZ50_18735 [bacterium]|nr:hypothetical protein [bacterium]